MLTAGDSEERSSETLVVTVGKVEQLTEIWKRTWQRPPSDAELEGVIENHLREEIYYREALAMGLDRDDTIVRRHLRQKLEFLTNDMADAAAAPTDEDLQGWLARHVDQVRDPDRISFDHVYLSPDRRGEALWDDAADLLSRLGAEAGLDPSGLGDPLLLP